MYFEDEENVHVVQFGTGDTVIASGLTADLKNGTISLIDNCNICHPIGTEHKYDKEIIPDTELNTVVRLVFTDSKSIDVFIEELQKAAKYMENPELHPWHDEMKEKP